MVPRKTTRAGKRKTVPPAKKGKAGGANATKRKTAAGASAGKKASGKKASGKKASGKKASAARAVTKPGVRRGVAIERRLEPTTQEIAERAYAIFQRAGSVHGHDVEHWLVAERELRAERVLER